MKNTPSATRRPAARKPGKAEPPKARTTAFPIVGVGASAGGLEAFTELLKHLPVDTGMAFVLVQHLDPKHESALSQLLGRATTMPVRDAANGLRVEPDHVYVIPPNTLMGIAGGVLALEPRPATRTAPHPVDHFFERLAQDQGERAIGVVLSGTASDGTLGLETIKSEGGITLAQDESARYDSMPRSAIAAGVVDVVLAPAQIAAELARIARHPYLADPAVHEHGDPELDRAAAVEHEGDATPLPSGGSGTPAIDGVGLGRRTGAAPGQKASEDAFRKILLLLRNHCGVDFALYKSTTIRRRILRRTALINRGTLASYAEFLRGNARELDALYSDLLISVTSFFRNPEAFELLKRKVFPKLLQRSGDDPVRVWVLGCSTGQEAYSIAMAFLEVAEGVPRARRLQVFATDLNDVLLDKARQGLYARTLAQDISAERLRRFFVEEEGGYRIAKPLRDMIVFARQNVISDPPFSRIDLISCRNLLIYLEPSVQKRAILMFHYALRADGHLLLGASESVGGHAELFEQVDKKFKLYARKSAPAAVPAIPARRDADGPGAVPVAVRPTRVIAPDSPDASREELTAQREADRLTVSQFAPPAVLVDADLRIIQFRGATGAFLAPPSGKASFDLLKMAREGLMLPLRRALTQARKSNRAAHVGGIRMTVDGAARLVSVRVIPLRNLKDRSYLVLFEGPESDARETAAGRARPRAASSRARAGAAESRRIAELEKQLEETQDYVQSIQEQHEAANEELQASNEEVQSANEELQSINEELETSKEELESANEELTTVNEEMATRNAELSRLNSDLVNLQSSTNLGIVLLGRDLGIRRFSLQAEKQLHLTALDIGRPLATIRHDFERVETDSAGDAHRTHGPAGERAPMQLEPFLAEVIDTMRESEAVVRDREGRWLLLRARPYISIENKVDGAVLVITDIDAIKRAEQAVVEARDEAAAIVATVRDPLLVLDAEMRILVGSESFYRLFGLTPSECVGRILFELEHGRWDLPVLRHLLHEIVPRDSQFDDFRIDLDLGSRGKRILLLNGRRLVDGERPWRILLGIQDVTEQQRAQAQTRQLQARYEALVRASAQIVWTATPQGSFEEDAPDWRAFTGQGPAQWRGSGWMDAIHSEDAAAVGQRWRAAVADGTPLEVEFRLRHAGGEWRWMILRAAPVRNEDGTIREWFGTLDDNSDRRLAEEALRESMLRFRQLADAMPQIVWTAQPDGTTDFLNRRWYEFTGFEPDQPQAPWETIIHPEDRGRVTERYAASIRTGEPYEIEYRMRDRVRGDDRWFMARALPIRDEQGGIIRWFGTCTDIDEQKKLEQELEARVEELREVDAARGQFLAVLSHELRSPLHAIRSWSHLLNLRGSEDEEARRGLEIIERSSRLQALLIEELLDAHRLGTGKTALDLEHVDLRAVVEAAIGAEEPALAAGDLRIVRDLGDRPAPVLADPMRLQQVIGNLLTNARKFSSPGGAIRVSVERDNGAARVSVSDEGEGIDPAALDRIFEPFRQAESGSRRTHGGLGLGLSIARQLVHLHGGTIQATSGGRGHGATFTVTLPLRGEEGRARRDAVTDGSDAGRSGALAGAVVLIVDDEPDAREPLRRILEVAGANVMSTATAAEALDAMRAQRPDLLVSDLAMPGQDGFALLRAVRALPPGRGGRIPAIALTGLGAPEERSRALEAGFDAHLVKPVEPAELVDRLAALFHCDLDDADGPGTGT